MTTEKNQDNTSALPEDQNVRTVTLETPIQRGAASITEIQIRKPNVGTLRNLSLQDVLKWEVQATNVLLSRVTAPALSINDLNQMNVSDYTSLAVELTSFLVSAKQKSQAALTM